MKRFNRYIILISAFLLILVVFSVHTTFAADGKSANLGDSGGGLLTDFLGMPSLTQLVAQSLANLFSTLQTIAAWLIAVAGSLLNYSINLTLNMKTFVDNTPAIFTIWKAIRDISGMIIIFSLIFAALRLILGFDAKFGDLIKNIVIAGILINFSFFATGLGIDASNIISMQLYNTIAPANTLDTSGTSPASSKMNTSKIEQLLSDGGLSDLFMKSLNTTTLYNNSASLSNAGKNDGGGLNLPIKIVIQGVTAILIMVTAAFSFFFAALAFMVRFVILLILLAFSPIWFASHVLPELQEYAKKWTGLYTGQLLFMPVYLLLMYFALSVMTANPYLSNLGASVSGTSVSDDAKLIALIINAALVLIMMNIPLLAAIKLGGSATGWIEKGGYSKTFGTGISKWVGSRTARDTVGKVAYGLNDSRAVKKFAAVLPGVGGAISKGLGKVGNAGFGMKKGGYEDALKEKKKNQTALFKKIGTVDRAKYDTEEEYQKAIAKAEESQKAYAKKLTSNLSTPIKNWGSDKGRDARIAEVDAKGIAHYGSEEEYQNARADAAKTPFMSKAFNGRVGKLLSFMFDSRAGKESGFVLTEEANIKNTRKAKEANDAAIAAIVATRESRNADIIAAAKKEDAESGKGLEELSAKRIRDIDQRIKNSEESVITEEKQMAKRMKEILPNDNELARMTLTDVEKAELAQMDVHKKEILDNDRKLKESLTKEKADILDTKVTVLQLLAKKDHSDLLTDFTPGEKDQVQRLKEKNENLKATIARIDKKKQKEDRWCCQ